MSSSEQVYGLLYLLAVFASVSGPHRVFPISRRYWNMISRFVRLYSRIIHIRNISNNWRGSLQLSWWHGGSWSPWLVEKTSVLSTIWIRTRRACEVGHLGYTNQYDSSFIQFTIVSNEHTLKSRSSTLKRVESFARRLHDGEQLPSPMHLILVRIEDYRSSRFQIHTKNKPKGTVVPVTLVW